MVDSISSVSSSSDIYGYSQDTYDSQASTNSQIDMQLVSKGIAHNITSSISSINETYAQEQQAIDPTSQGPAVPTF